MATPAWTSNPAGDRAASLTRSGLEVDHVHVLAAVAVEIFDHGSLGATGIFESGPGLDFEATVIRPAEERIALTAH